MKVIITGSSGMIGSLILNQCLHSENITEVISLMRKPGSLKHPKLSEVVIENFEDYGGHEHLFKNITAAFFCLGVYTGQVPDDEFKKITVDYAVAFAKKLEEQSPGATLCLLSGAGADRTEKSRTSFARYKGMAENRISQLNLKFYSFRPGYIYPENSRKEPNLIYEIMKWLYPLWSWMGSSMSIRSTLLAKAMFYAGFHGAEKQILENRDILALMHEKG